MRAEPEKILDAGKVVKTVFCPLLQEEVEVREFCIYCLVFECLCRKEKTNV